MQADVSRKCTECPAGQAVLCHLLQRVLSAVDKDLEVWSIFIVYAIAEERTKGHWVSIHDLPVGKTNIV